MPNKKYSPERFLVALFVSAWIEIIITNIANAISKSRTLCECVD